MTGFIDVLLRGLLLACVSIAVGGVAWLRVVLRVEPGTKPDAAAAGALRIMAAGAFLAAAAQAAVIALVLVDLAPNASGVPLGPYLETTFARVAVGRVALAVGLGVIALRLAARPGGRGTWTALIAVALGLVVSSAALSHASARLDDRALLLTLDAVHQLAVAIWIGGLAHLALQAFRTRREPDPRDRDIARRFSSLALGAVATVVLTGLAMTVRYVGEPAAMVGTAYGVMIMSKIVLLAAMLGLGWTNFRLVRRAAAGPSTLRLSRLVETELGLGITVLFAAASLTSLPPAIDVGADRASIGEVTDRFIPAPPRLTSPPVEELHRAADPLLAPAGERAPVERAWSEYNHHWAGFFVLAMGVLAVADLRGVRAARHWPLVLLGMAAFLFVRSDPRAWPLGPTGFWESMALPDVLQHRAFVLLVVAFGVFEWMVRTGRLNPRPWGYVFPLLCAIGGGLLLTHSHAMFNLKEEFLTEVTHAPIGILGSFAGWARWLEVRLPQGGSAPGWLWRACFIGVGLLLVFYREG